MSRWHKAVRFSTSPRYAAFRRFVFDRDGWRCRECGRPGALELHHIRPLSAGGEVWDETNVMSCCRGCHIRMTARGNKRDKSPTEIRWQALVDSLYATEKERLARDG